MALCERQQRNRGVTDGFNLAGLHMQPGCAQNPLQNPARGESLCMGCMHCMWMCTMLRHLTRENLICEKKVPKIPFRASFTIEGTIHVFRLISQMAENIVMLDLQRSKRSEIIKYNLWPMCRVLGAQAANKIPLSVSQSYHAQVNIAIDMFYLQDCVRSIRLPVQM